MPPVIPYLVYAGAVVAYYAGPYIVAFAVSYAVNTLLAPKPGQQQQAGGIAGKQNRTLTFRQPAAPRKLIYGQVRVGGTQVFVHSTDDNMYLHQIIALAGHQCEEIGDIYFNDELVPLDGSGLATGKYAGYATIEKWKGTPGQGPLATLIAAAPDKWTSAHRLRGVAYLYVKLKFSRDIFPAGLPNVSAIVKGKRVYDPRSSTIVWSDNAALCTSDYLTDSTYGVGADYATEINEAELIASANTCDEAVALNGGGTESRYTCNGVVSSDERPRDVLTGMNSAKAAATINTHGKWVIKAGAYDAPTVSLDENDLRGNIKVVTRVSRNNLFNAVKGVYISAKNSYQPADFPPITNSTYETQDNNERIWRDIDLEFTNTSSTAQRIAKIELEKTRQQIRVELPCKLSALELMAGSNFNFSNARMGWTNKVFEVENWRLEYYNDDAGNPALGVLLLVRETASTIFDWNSGEETTTDPAPDTDLPDAFTVGPPTGLILASGTNELLVTTDGTVVSRIKATWSAPTDAFVAQYEISFQRTTESEWTDAIVTNTEYFIASVKDGDLYNIRVRAINILGVRSEWLSEFNYLAIGKTEAPPDVDTFLVNRQADGTREFSWTQASPPPDHAGYKIRYKLGTGHTWDELTPMHEGLLIASPFETNQLAAGNYTLAIKEEDTTGNESVNALFIVSDLGDPRIVNTLLTEDPRALGWPGTKTDCIVDNNGDLIPTGQEIWGPEDFWLASTAMIVNDEARPVAYNGHYYTVQSIVGGGVTDSTEPVWPSSGTVVDNEVTWVESGLVIPYPWSAWTQWNETPSDPYIYEHTTIDLGAVVVFTPLLSATTPNGSQTIEMNTSDDDITYSGWVAAAFTTARYIKLRNTVIGDTVGTGFTQMFIIISAETVEEDITDLDTSTISNPAGVFRVPLVNSYSIISQVSVALQNVGAGYSWEIIDKNATLGPQIKIYDGTDTLADATVDIHIKGL